MSPQKSNTGKLASAVATGPRPSEMAKLFQRTTIGQRHTRKLVTPGQLEKMVGNFERLLEDLDTANENTQPSGLARPNRTYLPIEIKGHTPKANRKPSAPK